jgi:hypothetical protein
MDRPLSVPAKRKTRLRGGFAGKANRNSRAGMDSVGGTMIPHWRLEALDWGRELKAVDDRRLAWLTAVI